MAETVEIRVVTADERPPVGRWCVLLDPDGDHRYAQIAEYDGEDWREPSGRSWSARTGDRYIVLPAAAGLPDVTEVGDAQR